MAANRFSRTSGSSHGLPGSGIPLGILVSALLAGFFSPAPASTAASPPPIGGAYIREVGRISAEPADWLTSGSRVLLSGEGGTVRIARDPDPGKVLASFSLEPRVSGAVVVGSYAYLLQAGIGLRLLDLALPGQPEDLGPIPMEGDPLLAAQAGDLLVVARGGFGLSILDISDPVAPREIGFLGTTQHAAALAVSGNEAYLGSPEGDVVQVDLSDPGRPFEAGTIRLGCPLSCLAADGDLLFAGGPEGLRVVDISDPVHPETLVSSEHPVWGLALHGRTLLMAEGRKGIGRAESGRNEATTVTVNVGNFFFNPSSATLSAGDSILWKWVGGTHSTTSGTCSGGICVPDGLWDSGVHSGTFTYTRAFSTAGTFPYYCSVHLSSMKGTVIVNAGTPLAATASAAPTGGVAPLTVSFTGSASGGGGGYTYDWDFGDGTAHSTQQNPSHIYQSAGSYPVVLTVHDAPGASATDGHLTISVTAPCTVTCSASADPTSGTVPLQVAFTSTATATNCSGSPAYLWAFGDGTTSNLQNPTHTYATVGPFDWSMTVTVGGTTCTQGGTVVVSAPCGLTCTADAAPASGTAPLTVTFTASATPANCQGTPGFSWDFGDGATSAEQNPAHTYALPGAYTWSMTVSVNSVTCFHSGRIDVSPPCTLACSASAVPSSGVAPLAVSFVASATPANCGGPPAYSWSFGDGNGSGLPSPVHSYASPGTYDWTLVVTADHATCERAGSVTVSPPCTLTCTATASSASGTVPLTVSFASTASPSNCSGPPAYLWTFGDGSMSAEPNPSHTYATVGPFDWSLAVTVDGATCTQTGVVDVSAPCGLTCAADAAPSAGVAPLAVSFTASAIPANCAGVPAYSWAFGDGIGSTEQNPPHTYAAPGTYAWSVTVAVEGVTCSHQGTVAVHPRLPGDCDGDGSIGIGEVQRAINMFLGLQVPGCGVDCSGDGVVGIGEVQRVINGFLGFPTSC